MFSEGYHQKELDEEEEESLAYLIGNRTRVAVDGELKKKLKYPLGGGRIPMSHSPSDSGGESETERALNKFELDKHAVESQFRLLAVCKLSNDILKATDRIRIARRLLQSPTFEALYGQVSETVSNEIEESVINFLTLFTELNSSVASSSSSSSSAGVSQEDLLQTLKDENIFSFISSHFSKLELIHLLPSTSAGTGAEATDVKTRHEMQFLTCHLLFL